MVVFGHLILFNFGVNYFLHLFIRNPEAYVPGNNTTEGWNESVNKEFGVE